MTHISLRHSDLPDVNRFFAFDDVEQPNQFARFLEEAKALPGILAAKAEMLERLRPEDATTALDVGCGYGADVIELAKRLQPDGRAMGVDISETMLAEANRRAAGSGLSVTFGTGDALALPFEDDMFDICRVETVLQHVADPETGITEMTRVTRSGGRIAALEFDLETLFLDHHDTGLTETIWTSYLRETVQPSMGRQLPRLFVRAGLTEVASAPRVVTADPGFFRLVAGHHVDRLCADDVITSDQAASWWTAIADADAGGFHTGGATAFLVSGTVS
jgi:ubiquinone/menaquinone biosynthesis C-methylase UbiE